MLKGQAITAYNNYMQKSMAVKPKEIKAAKNGLLSRDKPKEQDEFVNDDSYLIDQFKELKKLRAGLNNG